MSMELIKPGIHLDFVGKIKYAAVFSATLDHYQHRISYSSRRFKSRH